MQRKEESASICGYDAHKTEQTDWDLNIVERPADLRGFTVQSSRWVVGRTLSWISRNRRMSKAYERAVQTSETLIHVAMIWLLLARQDRRT